MFKGIKHFLFGFIFLITVTSFNAVNNKVLSDKHNVLKIEDVVKLFKKNDYKKALSSLNIMCNKNNIKAQNLYSQIFYAGNITPQDFEKAYFWSNIAYLGGYKKSEKITSLLDDILEEDQKTKINAKIKVFLEKHAKEKNKLAILQLAKYYLKLADEIDYANAYKWYNVAVAMGIKTATKKRDEMLSELSAEQIIEAQKLSNEIFNRMNKTKE